MTPAASDGTTTAREGRDDLSRLAVLQDPVRRQLYDFVVGQQDAVGRDAAAAAVDVTRRLAAFHLDRLAEAGLLEVSYRRLTARSGPGAGRPAKLYARASDELSVSIPPRRYELAAHLLAAAVERVGAAAGPAVAAAARDFGAKLAARYAVGATTAAKRRRCLHALLSDLDYEPYDADDGRRLRNCPFHVVADQHRELVCTANLHLLQGAADRLKTDVTARLDPRPGECCVALQPGSRSPERKPASRRQSRE